MKNNSKEHLNELKKDLSLMINQQKMLNNTLCEMYQKGNSKDSIDKIKQEITELNNEIEFIMNEMKLCEETYENEVNYVHYNEDMCCEGENSKCNVKSIQPCFCRVLNNKFIVNLEESLFIPKSMVCSFDHDFKNKMFWISMYDFVTDLDGKKFPIMQVLKYRTDEFDFNVKYFDENENELYTEYVCGCKIDSCYAGTAVLGNDNELRKITLYIKYNNICFEATNKKEGK